MSKTETSEELLSEVLKKGGTEMKSPASAQTRTETKEKTETETSEGIFNLARIVHIIFSLITLGIAGLIVFLPQWFGINVNNMPSYYNIIGYILLGIAAIDFIISTVLIWKQNYLILISSIVANVIIVAIVSYMLYLAYSNGSSNQSFFLLFEVAWALFHALYSGYILYIQLRK